MRIAYFTTDDVHRAVARRFAKRCGVILTASAGKAEAADALLYDWDYLKWAGLDNVLTELFKNPKSRAVAVHGYNLSDSQRADLGKNGVLVFRRLTQRVLRSLSRRIQEQRLSGLTAAGRT
jgi:hypothetical protein